MPWNIRKASLRFVKHMAISYPVIKQVFFKNPYQNVNVKYLTYSLYSIYDACPIPIHFVNRISNTWTEISSPMVTTFIITFTGRFVAEWIILTVTRTSHTFSIQNVFSIGTYWKKKSLDKSSNQYELIYRDDRN